MLRRFAKSRKGLAAVEFALIAPVMAGMLLGTVEICDALSCHQKVTAVASTAADLVAQTSTVSTSDIDNVFNAVNAILYPYPSASAQIVISSLVSDGNGGATVAWSEAQNTSALQTGNTMTIPDGLMPAYSCQNGTCTGCAQNACSLIFAQITYSYTAPNSFISGLTTMSDHFYSRPRESAAVTCTDCDD